MKQFFWHVFCPSPRSKSIAGKYRFLVIGEPIVNFKIDDFIASHFPSMIVQIYYHQEVSVKLSKHWIIKKEKFRKIVWEIGFFPILKIDIQIHLRQRPLLHDIFPRCWYNCNAARKKW